LLAPAGDIPTHDDSDVEMSVCAQPRNKGNGSWSKEEKDELVQFATECHALGHRGENFWDCVKDKMAARGVPRPVGGMRMVWLRGLREETQIDERRRQNSSKMRTAIQKSRKEKVVKEAKESDDEMMEDAGHEAEEEGGAEIMEDTGFGFDPEVTVVPRVQRFRRQHTASI